MWAALRSAARSRPYASGSAVTAYLQEEGRHARREPNHSLVTGDRIGGRDLGNRGGIGDLPALDHDALVFLVEPDGGGPVIGGIRVYADQPECHGSLPHRSVHRFAYLDDPTVALPRQGPKRILITPGWPDALRNWCE